MDYKLIWKGLQGAGYVHVWVTSVPEKKIYIAQNTNIISVSIDEAQEISENILKYIEKIRHEKNK